MGYSHTKVVELFKERDGQDGGFSGNLWFSGGMLYSYGSHFPLACRIPDTDKYLVNVERRSVSTSKHQRECQQGLPYVVSVAASAFPFPVMRDALGGSAKLLDNWEDQFTYGEADTREKAGSVYRGRPGWTVWVKDRHGAAHRSWNSEVNGKRFTWEAHRPGAALFEHEGKRYLSGVDSRNYFVCELPGSPETVGEAFDSLKPFDVRFYEGLGRTVHRQGEWYFMETDHKRSHFAGVEVKRSLEDAPHKAYPDKFETPSGVGNYHHPRAVIVRRDGIMAATGCVYHRGRYGGLTHEHPTLKLGKKWHRVYRNLAVQSWSSHGGFD